MIRKERLNSIIEYLELHSETSIQSLAKEFKISPITMRLDIKELAKKGLLDRSHGSVSVSKNKFFLGGDINDRIIRDNELKSKLLKRASEYINPGETIFLDDSSTVYNIIQFLIDIPGLTVVTHSLSIMYSMRNVSHIHLIGLGGTFCNIDQSFTGTSVINKIKEMTFDISFTSCWSLDSEYGSSETSNNASNIKKTVSEHSKKNIIIMQSNKFNNKKGINSISWKNITKVITDKMPVNFDKEKLLIVDCEKTI